MVVLVLLPRARVADREKLRIHGRYGLISREKAPRAPDARLRHPTCVSWPISPLARLRASLGA